MYTLLGELTRFLFCFPALEKHHIEMCYYWGMKRKVETLAENTELSVRDEAAISTMRIIFSRVIEGAKLKEACREFSITPQTYYNWVAKYPDSLKDLYTLNTAVSKSTLVRMLTAKERIVERLLEKAESVTASTADILAILGYIDRAMPAAEEAHAAGSVREEDRAARYLRGINKKPGESRLEIHIHTDSPGEKPIVIDGTSK